jgi:branched-chain amino acid transport system substrate-binding protein
MQKLLQIDKVTAVMPALSSIVLACAPIAQQNNVVLLNCPANSPKLRGAGSFVFSIAILSDQESEFLADYAFNKMGARSVGIFFVNNESGRGYRDSFATKFSALGGQVKLSEGHEQGATEFRTVVEKFRAAQVDLVFLTSYYSESALFLRQAKELGYHNKWLSYASIETPDFLKLAGDAADGIIFSQPGFDAQADDPLTIKFVREYRKRYGQDPDFWTAQYYEGAMLLASAVASGARTGEEVQAYLRNLKQFAGITGKITFDENGCVTRKVRFKIVRNSTFEYIDNER